jgi:hypothetical protein
MSVIITETAAREIANIVRQQDLNSKAIHLRVGVKGGGCSGFSYLLDLTETVRDSDEAWEFDYTPSNSTSFAIQRACSTSTAPRSTSRTRSWAEVLSSTIPTQQAVAVVEAALARKAHSFAQWGRNRTIRSILVEFGESHS